MMLKMGRRASGHFVMLIEISVCQITFMSGPTAVQCKLAKYVKQEHSLTCSDHFP